MNGVYFLVGVVVYCVFLSSMVIIDTNFVSFLIFF